MNIQGTVITSD